MKYKLYYKLIVLTVVILSLLVGCQSASNEHINHQQHDNSNISILENKQEIKQQGYGLFGVSSFHEKNIKGDHVKIAVLDTGVDFENSDLKVYKFKNFIDENENNVQDKNGHGTKVSGIISAQDNKSGLLGIAPNVELYIGKVANDMGYVKSDDLIKGIKWAIEQKVDIINISLELYKNNDDLHNIIKEAYNKNIIIVSSSGNQKDDHSKRVVSYPGAYDEVISVGMLNTEGKLSEHGFKDSKIKVYAPGEDIVSTYLNNQLTLDTATSFATAYVSGYTALLIQEHKDKGESYDQKTIINQLQSVFHKYMGTSLNSTLKMVMNICSLILTLVIVGLLIYLIFNFKNIKRNQKVRKRILIIGSILILLNIISRVLVIFLPEVASTSTKQQEKQNHQERESNHQHSNISMRFMKDFKPETKELKLTAHLSHDNTAFEAAAVTFELWIKDKSVEKKHIFIDAKEVSKGEYMASTPLEANGEYNVKVHAKKGDVHTHIDEKFSLN